MFSLTKSTARQREIIEIVFSNGWDYMKGLLTGGKTDEPQLPTPEVLRNILVELGPFYVKFGQLLSTRPDILPPNYIVALTALQAKVPTVPWLEMETVLKEQFSQPLNEIFSNINQEPIAAGSIAQIHKAILITGEEVALKIQRPNIDKIVEQDIQLIKSIAELVYLTEFGQNYDVIKLAEEFTQAVKAELNFTTEARYTDQLRRNLLKSKWFNPQDLVIPQIYWELTTEKILVMQWLNGKPILEAKINEEIKTKEEITTLLFRAFFQQYFFDGFFHADPHPGNLFYLETGKVAIIDLGMMGRLDPRTQQLITEMLLAIVDLDAKRCSQLTLELSDTYQAPSLPKLENDYEQILRKYYKLNLAELNFSEVFYDVLQIARKNKIKLPSNLGLFTKSLANLEGVARKFNPEINVFQEIKPLITDLFQKQIFGDTPLQTFLRTVLDVKSLYLQTPRQIEVLLDRFTSETLEFNLKLKELEPLRRSVDDSANRLSFSIVVGSLIIGAAIISGSSQTRQLSFISNILFAAASFIGFWLIISILRSGRLK